MTQAVPALTTAPTPASSGSISMTLPFGTGVRIAVRGVTGTEFRVWGFGVAQDIDAASATIFAGYRHFENSIRCTDLVTAATCSGGVSPTAVPGTFTTHKLPTEPLDVIITGARVEF